MPVPNTVQLDEVPYPPVDGTQPCSGEGPDTFFPHPSFQEGHDRARAICEPCPFRRACLAYALVNDVQGVWGGTSETQRKNLRAEHGIRPRRITTSDRDALHAAVAEMERGGGIRR